MEPQPDVLQHEERVRQQAKIVEETLHIPCFYIEADFWDDREYSPEALRTKIESICQVFKMRLAAMKAGKE